MSHLSKRTWSGVLAVVVVACNSSSAGTGDGGVLDLGRPGGGTSADGGAGGGAAGGGGRSTLADGTVGSSCTGACGGDLACFAQAPQGYCTKTCASNDDCGAVGRCMNVSGNAACLRACTGDSDCRAGYTCQESDGQQVCYVDPAAAGGTGGTNGTPATGGTDCLPNIEGTWGRECGGSCEQYTFSADGSVVQDSWNAASGQISTSGSYTLSCPNLIITLQGSGPNAFTAKGTYFVENKYPSIKYVRCNGKCF